MAIGPEANNVRDIVDHRGRSRPVAGGLERLTDILQEACPGEAEIHFDYHRGILRVLIDVRTAEEVIAVEAVLKVVSIGTFHSVSRAAVPGRPFLKRVVAFVEA